MSSDVFAAIADPTRRAILELLREAESLTAGEIAAAFAHLSRPAVSKHLGVLRGAELVSVVEDGRERYYSLDVGPLAALARDFLDPFAPLWDERLARLKRNAER